MTTKTLTVKEVAAELDVSAVTVYNLINDGLLPATKSTSPRNTYVAATDVRKLKQARTTGTPRVSAAKVKQLRDALFDLGDDITNNYPTAFGHIADRVYELVDELPQTGGKS